MHTHTRAAGSVLAVAGLVTVLSTALSSPAQAMPERFDDAGTIVWCEGEGGTLTAIDTALGGTFWSADLLVGDRFAFAGGEAALFDGTGLHGSAPAYDGDTGDALGDLVVDGTIARGETEIVSGWDFDEDGRRTQTEGTRTSLTGQVTLTVGATSTVLDCVGLDFELETFTLTRSPAATVDTGWWADSYELDGGAGVVGFYGEKQNQLGISLDLFSPTYVIGGEQLQVRNGQVEGSLLLRDPETFAVVGVATVSGTVTETGREQSVEIEHGYQQVTDLVHYDVALTVSSDRGEWSGTWGATHETGRTLSVVPPRAL